MGLLTAYIILWVVENYNVQSIDLHEKEQQADIDIGAVPAVPQPEDPAIKQQIKKNSKKKKGKQ